MECNNKLEGNNKIEGWNNYGFGGMDDGVEDSIELLKLQNNYPYVQLRSREVQFKINFLKTKILQVSGVCLVSTNAGLNGAQFVEELNNKGKAIGVFKCPQEISSIDQKIKSFVGQKRLLSSQYFSEQYAEVAASLLDRIFGFNVAPFAEVLVLDKQTGVFIEFFSDCSPLKNCAERFMKMGPFSEVEKTEWQKMCLFNFLVGNLDPHSENLFVRLGDEQLERACTIDFGNAFPVGRPIRFGYYGNEGAWGKYPISAESFTQETLEFITTNFQMENLYKFLEQVEEKCPGFMVKSMKQLLEERFVLIMTCAGTSLKGGHIDTPQKLAEIHYEHQYRDHMNIANKTILNKGDEQRN